MKTVLLSIGISIYLFFSAGTVRDAEAAFKLCQDIVDHCESSTAFGLGICMGYLEGLADKGDVGLCIPDNTPPKRLQEQFLKWTTEHPGQSLADAPICFTAAMVERFSCQADKEEDKTE